jgi:hypothetical protein
LKRERHVTYPLDDTGPDSDCKDFLSRNRWFGAGNGGITSNTSNLGFFGSTLMAGFNY